jgi:diguanylate cyclase (GGDEF)-like protein
VSALAAALAEAPTPALEIVLIEDSDDYAMLVEEMLRTAFRERFVLRHFTRLREARRHLAANETDCVLLDLSLPDSSGLHSLEQVQLSAPNVPVVVLSGLNDEEVAIAAVQEGAQDYLVKSWVDGAFVSRALRYAMERKRAEIELAHRALHDPLTGLPNRALFLDRLEVALARAARDPRSVAVMFIDLDRFKTVNDSLGHEVGDQVLIEVAARLEALVRPSDTVARFGGDEFMLLFDDFAEEQDAVLLADRISDGIAQPFVLGEQEFFLTASIGIAFAHGGAAGSAANIIRNADATMYRAKESGSRIELFSNDVRTSALSRLQLDTELHRAVERGELRVAYQPQVSLASGQIVGVEALVRWQHPTRGLLAPTDFIPLAEDIGLVTPIGLWVFEQACHDLAQWNDSAGSRAPVCAGVNLSPRQLTQPDLASDIAAILERTAVDPGQIWLELTESAVIRSTEAAAAVLHDIKALGVRLSVDDFGTGYSSLSALERFPIDALKIDRSFIEHLPGDSRSGRIVLAVIYLARAMGLGVIAEGVEQPEQMTELMKLGCDCAQGFLFARPVPALAMTEMLDRGLRLTPDGSGGQY